MGMVAILVMWHKPFLLISTPPSHGGSTWNLASISLAVSKEKKFENVESTLTFDIHTGSCTHLVNYIYQLWYHSLQ